MSSLFPPGRHAEPRQRCGGYDPPWPEPAPCPPPPPPWFPAAEADPFEPPWWPLWPCWPAWLCPLLAAAEIVAPLTPAVPVVECASAEISAPCPWPDPFASAPPFALVESSLAWPALLRPLLASAAISAPFAAPVAVVVRAVDETAAPCVPASCEWVFAGEPVETPSECRTPRAVADAAAGRPVAYAVPDASTSVAAAAAMVRRDRNGGAASMNCLLRERGAGARPDASMMVG